MFRYCLNDAPDARRHVRLLVGPADWIVFIALYFPFIWISWAVGVKRLHDRSKSAWWLVLFYIAPASLNVAASFVENPLHVPINLSAISIFVWMIVELGFLRGTVGPNDYGPDPLEPPPGIQPA